MTANPLPSCFNSFQGRKVFVTGHTGFKGSWLCEWLLSLGADVTGFSLPGSVTNPSLFDQLGLSHRIIDIRGNIRDATSIRQAILQARPDFLFHLAAQPLVRLSYTEPVETWETNVMGTIHVLEATRGLATSCTAVLITTDKCYENREWARGYREEDALGGYDPYSSSKAACELAIAAWRRSFLKDHPVRVVSARAGNVIGGGDWAADRIIPDCIRALQKGEPVPVRNKTSTRPWQHVLEPLSGYLRLADAVSKGELDENLLSTAASASAFNFGPDLESNGTVAELVLEVLKHLDGTWIDQSDPNAPHEAGKLNLATDKAFHTLGWRPKWTFEKTIEKTIEWYRESQTCQSPEDFQALTRQQIEEYNKS